MRRLLPVFLVTILAVIALVIRTLDDPTPVEHRQATTATGKDDRQLTGLPVTDSRLTPDHQNASLAGDLDSDLPPDLADKSSWTNPYNPSVWNASGWRFDEDAMLVEPQESATTEAACTAEFLREWLTFTAGLHVSFETSPEARSPNARQLILETVDRDSSDVLRVTLQPGRAAVDSIQDGQTVLLRENPVSADFEFSHIRLLLTPNRLLVRGDDRLLLNAPRPASLIGKRCRFRITAAPGTTIRELRFDGE